MIKYIVSSLNSDLNTAALLREASRCLFLAVNPDTSGEYSEYNMFQVSDLESDSIMIVDTSEVIQINNKSHLSDFLNLFSISDQEKSNILSNVSTGDKVSFLSISPSTLVESDYSDLITMGLAEADTVD